MIQKKSLEHIKSGLSTSITNNSEEEIKTSLLSVLKSLKPSGEENKHEEHRNSHQILDELKEIVANKRDEKQRLRSKYFPAVQIKP
mmetsp:Transcript_3964/g.3734  ORF Transcript_3964/g.3734 Transcript_3964/m.3734 type:complete len:86 (+) Transcript_3964:352-609(+)